MPDFDNTNRGALFNNDYATSDKHPRWKGKLNVGGTDYKLSAWENTTRDGKPFLSLSIEPLEATEKAQDGRGGQITSGRKPVDPNRAALGQGKRPSYNRDGLDDEIPF